MSEFQEINKHLAELRIRILKIVIVVAVLITFLLRFHAVPIEFYGFTLYYPTPQPLDNMAAQLTNRFRENLVPEQRELVTGPPLLKCRYHHHDG